MCLLLIWGLAAPGICAQGASQMLDVQPETPTNSSSSWRYGAYLDAGFSVNFNFPDNDRWRSRTTTFRHNQAAPNMVLAYVRKDVSEASRWGMELGVQGGYDSVNFAFLQGEKKVDGADGLRHLHRANASYLASVGNGLKVTVGLFDSLMGYESLYAKDNVNYTRSWIADHTPYMMFGVNAAYPVNDRLTVTAFVINRYYHLAYTVAQPSYGGKWSYALTHRLTARQTLYWGPDQTEASPELWRLYGNHILEWKGDEVTIVASYDIGTENIADRPGRPRTFVMGGNFVVRWHVAGPWFVAVRPEFYWDRNGRWTGSEQFVKAVTSTVEYALPYQGTKTVVRMEHRYDESTGTGGGFFKNGESSFGVPKLTAGQHLLLFGLLLTFDSP